MFSLGYVVDFRFIALIKRSSFCTSPLIPAAINNIYDYLKYLFALMPFYGWQESQTYPSQVSSFTERAPPTVIKLENALGTKIKIALNLMLGKLLWAPQVEFGVSWLCHVQDPR